jgi:hypothetical protein
MNTSQVRDMCASTSWAAEKGHLEVLRYCVENGCSWDAEVCSSAFENDHMDLLRWACENGCPGSDAYLQYL